MKKIYDYKKIAEEIYPLYIEQNLSKRKVSEVTGYGFTCIDRAVQYAAHNRMFKKTKEMTQKCIENGMIEKYGAANSMYLDCFKEKVEKTNIERYGVSNPQQNEKIRNKTQNTNLERYGNICSAQGKEQIEKRKKTNLERYGVETFIPIPSHSSKAEFEIFDFIQSLGYQAEHNKHYGNTELDIYIPELNIGIEYNGVYWHGQSIKENDAQQKKCKSFLDRGISFLVVWEDEFRANKEKVFEDIKKYIYKEYVFDKDEYTLDLTKENIVKFLKNGYQVCGFTEPLLLSNGCYDGGNVILKIRSSTTIENIAQKKDLCE